MAPGEVRQPELALFANGLEISGVKKVDISANAYLCANRFTAHVAMSANISGFWSVLPLLIEIRAGLNGFWQSLITGNADSITLDPVRGEAILQGRDLTALLVQAETAETFENRTASDIATTLAVRHGLTPNVTPTNDIVGRYYQSGRTCLTLSQHANATSEWDVLTSLADQEGYDVWIDGKELFFQPDGSATGAMALSPFECTKILLHRKLDLAAGPTVVVKSWDSQRRAGVAGIAFGGGQSGPTFTTLRPNLSTADAAQLAQRTLAQLTAHQSEIECHMPGDLTTLPRMTLSVSGTGTDFDGPYRVMETERSISFSHGFTQTVVARRLPWTAS